MLQPQLRWYRRTVPLKGEVIADVGANVGDISQLFAERCGRKGKVVSIEPVPANIKAIETKIRRAKADKWWKLKRCACSNEDSRVTLRVIKASWGINSAVVPGDEGKTIEVPCYRLKRLVPDATVVKLDVEGHEYAILPDVMKTLGKQVRCYALELHAVEDHPLEATLGALVDAGYALITAGHRRDDPSEWLDVPIEPTLTWAEVPGTETMRDGVPGLFKMLHVIARR